MFKNIPKYLLLFLLAWSLKNQASAQVIIDTLGISQTSAYTNIERDFNKKLGAQSRLYNGIQYDQYDPHIKGNADYDDVDSLHYGSIFYDGFFYPHVKMLYDIYKDVAVIVIHNNFMRISLISEKVKYFDLLDRHFIYVKNDPANSNSLKSGFYGELYGGKIQVLSKKSKSIQNSTDYTGNIIPYFSPSKDYYLFKNGKYYTVNSEGSFLDVLADRKKEVKQFIKSNNIKFKKSPEQAMAAIAAYYDHLID